MTMIVVFFCPSRSCSEPLHMVPELPIGHLAWLARHPVHSELKTNHMVLATWHRSKAQKKITMLLRELYMASNWLCLSLTNYVFFGVISLVLASHSCACTCV
jgi:hypothetical protein